MDTEAFSKKYREREAKWLDKSLSQFSFLNNLLLTLSVGFSSIAFREFTFEGIKFLGSHIDRSLTFLALSITSAVLSITLGCLVALCRLYDFRISRQINQIRHRMMKHSGRTLDGTTADRFSRFTRFFLVFKVMISIPSISMKECEDFNKKTDVEQGLIREHFRELRNIANNLGVNSWQLTNWQMVCFIISIILYLVGRLTV